MAKDVVCGMEVDEGKPPPARNIRGKTYYFCSEYCKQEFDKEPEKYLAAAWNRRACPGPRRHEA